MAIDDGSQLAKFHLYDRPGEQIRELVVVFNWASLDDPLTPGRSALQGCDSPYMLPRQKDRLLMGMVDRVDTQLCWSVKHLDSLEPCEALGKLIWLGVTLLLG